MKAVILAGGRGERLGKLTKNIPKPLLKIGDKPLLEHQILFLKRYRVRDIWILSGYLGPKIQNYFGDGKKWGMRISHIVEEKPLGTAGAIKQLEGQMNRDFLVLSGDVMMDFDIGRLIKFHGKHKESLASIVVHPNDHPYDSDLVDVDENWRVTKLLLRSGKTQSRDVLFNNLTNAGVFILNERIFEYIPKGRQSDLEKDVFPQVLKKDGEIYAYKTRDYLKDIGTFKRIGEVRKDFKSGKIRKMNMEYKRAAIFLDRDGTINEKIEGSDVRFVDFRLFPFTARAIKRINESDYLAIVITNQPGVARGLITLDELTMIHKKLETELGWQGAKVDGIYYCPHHPDGGFRGEVRKLKIKCRCRKPATGLINKAVAEFNVDLKKSFFIGDSTLDAKCAKNAGIRFVGVGTGFGVTDKKFPLKKRFLKRANLLRAASYILGAPRPYV